MPAYIELIQQWAPFIISTLFLFVSEYMAFTKQESNGVLHAIYLFLKWGKETFPKK